MFSKSALMACAAALEPDGFVPVCFINKKEALERWPTPKPIKKDKRDKKEHWLKGFRP